MSCWRVVWVASLLAISSVIGAEPPAGADRFGEPLPDGAVARLGLTRSDKGELPGGEQLPCVAVSLDGKRLARRTASHVSVWDVATGRLALHLPVACFALGLSADGQTLWAVIRGGVVRSWDVNTGRAGRDFRIEYGLHAVFSPDSATLAVPSAIQPDKSTRKFVLDLWDVPTGKRRHQIPDCHVLAQAFSADGARLVTVEHLGGALGAKLQTVIRLWDVATGREEKRLPTREDVRPEGVAVTPDGKTIGLAGYQQADRKDFPIYFTELLDAATGQVVRRFKDHGPRPAFSPDGKLLATANRVGTIELYDLASGERLRQFVQPGGFFGLDFAPDGRTIVACPRAPAGGVCLWDVADGRTRYFAEGHSGSVSAVAFSHDGKRVASAGANVVIVWDLPAREAVARLLVPGQIIQVALSRDGRVLLTRAQNEGSVGIRLWDLARGAEIPWPAHTLALMAFSDDGTTLAVAPPARLPGLFVGPPAPRQNLNAVRFLWHWLTHPELHCFRLAGPGKQLAPPDQKPELLQIGGKRRETSVVEALSPDGSVVVERIHGFIDMPTTNSGGHAYTGGIRLVDAANGEPFRILDLQVRSLQFSADTHSLLLSMSDKQPGAVALWEIASGKERLRIPLGQMAPHLALAPDGKALASADQSDPAIRLWDARTGAALGRFEQPKANGAGTLALAISPDGCYLASGHTDGTVLVWDLAVRLGKRPPPPELTAAERNTLWDELAATDAARAYRAVARLADGQSTDTVADLRVRLNLDALDQRVTQLVADLEGQQFDVRQRATQELEKLGELAGPGLWQALTKKPSLEMQRRLEQILARLGALFSSPAGLRLLRVIEVLEAVGTPEARTLLESMTRGTPNDPLARQSRAALKRLSVRPATTAP